MKIYNKKPEYLVRIQISKQGEKTQYQTFCDTTINEVLKHCEKTIETQNISPFAKGKRTSINIRESLGGQNGKSVSISFNGLSTEKTMELIVKNL